MEQKGNFIPGLWERVSHPAPEWFRDAKFGLFFHWGPYSVPGYMNEWYSRNMYCKGFKQNIYHERTYGSVHDFGYKDFIPMLRGEAFDPGEWAELTELSGAKYAGPVTEHCDNFSLWNSRVNPVNSVNMGPRRDVFGECADALRRRGIRVLATFHHQWLWGWFMSTDSEADVYLPENEVFYGPALPLETNRYIPYRLPDEAFCRTWRDKVIEVIDGYSPDVLYFDSRACIIDEAYRFDVVDHYYRAAGRSDGIVTFKQEDFPACAGVYDTERGSFALPRPFPWQTDDRLEDNTTWCIVQDPKYRSAGSVIRQLCDVVSKNGNLLLNVGPRADGSFHPDAVRELRAVGEWLRRNGEAIYGSRPFAVAAEGPATVDDSGYDVAMLNKELKGGAAAELKNQELGEHDFRFTAAGGALYAIGMDWPQNGEAQILTLRRGGPMGEISSVSLLGGGGPLPFRRDDRALTVKLPERRPSEPVYVLKIN